MVFFCWSVLCLAIIPWAQHLWQDVNLPPLKPQTRWLINGLFIQVLAAFFWMMRSAEAGGEKRRYLWVLASVLPICAAWPVFSGDLWEYLIRGRILMHYGENPYTFYPQHIPDDLLYGHTSWRYSGLVYGPLSLLLQAVAAVIAPASMTASAFFFKVMLVPFWLWGVHSFAKLVATDPQMSDAQRRAAWIFNPLLIVVTFLDGHNDLIPTVACIAAFGYAWHRKPFPALLAWTAAFAVKYHVLILWPVLLLAILGRQQQTADRLNRTVLLRNATLYCMIQMGLAAAIFLPWWPGIAHSFSQLFRGLSLFYNNTLPYALHQGVEMLIQRPVPVVWIEVVLDACFGGVYLWGAYQIWTGARRGESVRIFRAVAAIHLAFFLQLTSPMAAWYLVWALPWIILSRWPLPAVMVTLFSFAGMFAYFKRINYLILLALGAYGTLCWVRAYWPGARQRA